ITAQEYPRCTSTQARSTLAAYAKQLRQKHFTLGAGLLGGETAASRSEAGTEHEKTIFSEYPFDICSMDAHRIDMHGVILIPTDKGVRRVPIQRMQLIILVEEFSRAVLAFLIVIRREPTAQDALQTLKRAFEPWQPRQLTLPGYSYTKGAGTPSSLIPSLCGCAWGVLMLDNASIHWSLAINERARERIGCAFNYGKARKWICRPIVESVLSSLERVGFHRLPNSCGTGPEDPIRPDSIKEAIEREITWEELLDVADVVITDY